MPNYAKKVIIFFFCFKWPIVYRVQCEFISSSRTDCDWHTLNNHQSQRRTHSLSRAIRCETNSHQALGSRLMQNIALQNLQIYIHMLLARGLQDLGCHSIRLLKKEGLFNTLVFCFSKVWRQVITCNSRVASAWLSFESLPPTIGGEGGGALVTQPCY